MGISAGPSADVEMSDQAVPAGGILPEKVIAEIDETHQTLSATRKKRKVPSSFATIAQVKTFSPNTPYRPSILLPLLESRLLRFLAQTHPSF
jgi:hypothetical protein